MAASGQSGRPGPCAAKLAGAEPRSGYYQSSFPSWQTLEEPKNTCHTLIFQSNKMVTSKTTQRLHNFLFAPLSGNISRKCVKLLTFFLRLRHFLLKYLGI